MELFPFFLCLLFQPLFLTLLASECSLLTYGHKPFEETGSYKSPTRKLIKASSIYGKTDLPPDKQDSAGSGFGPLGCLQEGKGYGGGGGPSEKAVVCSDSWRLNKRMGFDLPPSMASCPASGESSVFPFHPAQEFSTSVVSLSSEDLLQAKVSSLSLKKGP